MLLYITIAIFTISIGGAIVSDHYRSEFYGGLSVLGISLSLISFAGLELNENLKERRAREQLVKKMCTDKRAQEVIPGAYYKDGKCLKPNGEVFMK